MLNINSATVTDGGDYTCNVTNNAGSSSNTTTVYSKLIKLLSRDHYLESYSLESYCKCVACLCQQLVHASL